MTSIEILEEFLNKHCNPSVCDVEWSDLKTAIHEAKEMHKQEIKEAWCDGAYSDRNEISEQYYQETFVSKGSDELEQVVNDYDDDPTWIDDEVELPQQEIPDEEIQRVAEQIYPTDDIYRELWAENKCWQNGAKWYREQLKPKKY